MPQPPLSTAPTYIHTTKTANQEFHFYVVAFLQSLHLNSHMNLKKLANPSPKLMFLPGMFSSTPQCVQYLTLSRLYFWGVLFVLYLLPILYPL